MLNILSDQQLIAPILMSSIRRNIFCGKPAEEKLEHNKQLKS